MEGEWNMTTNKNEEETSGFNCSTIGNKIPKGYKLVEGRNGIWVLRRIDNGKSSKRRSNR